MNRDLYLWFIGGCLIVFATFWVEWGAYWVYPLSTGIILFSVSILRKFVSETWYLGLMFWIPAIGMCTWQRQILHLDMMYLTPREGILHLVKLVWQCHQNLWIILAVCSLILIKLERRLYIPMLVLTLTCGINQLLVEDLVKNMYQSAWNQANLDIWLIESLRIISIISVYPVWKKVNRQQKWSLCMVGLLNGWITAPFVALLLWSAPSTTPTLKDLPLSKTELGSLIPSAVPSLNNMQIQLNAQGTTSLQKINWWCDAIVKPNWNTRMRTYAVIEMSASSPLTDLAPYLSNIFSRGISEIGFLQQNPTKHFPPLSKHLQNPIQHWVLDPYPKDTRIGVWENSVIDWHNDVGTQCAVWVNWDTTQQSLSDLYSQLNQHCLKPFGLIIGVPANNWVSPIACSNLGH